MSDLKAVETALPDADARLAAIIDSSRDAIVATDVAGSITAWGPGATRISGYTEAEILGRHVSSLLAAEQVHELMALLARLHAGERVADLQTVIRRKDGARVHVSLSATPIYSDGEVVGVSAIARDVSASIEAELRSQAARRDVMAQQELLERIARGDSLDEVLDAVCREVEVRYPDGRCSILVVDAAERSLRHMAAPSLPRAFVQEIDGLPIALGMGACGTAAARREEVVVADVVTDPLTAPFVPLAREHGLRSVWSHPLVDRNGQILGTFAIYTSAPHEPNEQERRLVRAAGRIAAIAMERRRYEEALTLAALVDPLTGLPNRAGFLQRLQRALDDDPWSTAVLFLDLDQFKRVNDTLGHPVGDQLLREASKRLQSVLRDGDVLSRFGGDEFIVLARVVAGPTIARLALRLLAVLSEPFVLEGREFFVSASIGVAMGRHGVDAFDLVRDADVAMYDAKARGANRFTVFGEQLRHRAVEKVTLDAELRRAIERNELVIHYQPIFDLTSMTCTGAEALVRWQHPTRGLLRPSEFVPLAEESGLVCRLGAVVLDEVLRQARRWRDQGVDLPVAMNVSAVELSHPGLVDDVEAALARHGVEPRRLVVEITETAVMEHLDTARASLARLAALGVRVFIDDFGTGYSSIGRLSDLPVTGLKVDRRFTSELGTNPSITKVTVAIVDLAHALDLEVVAEGVETQRVVDVLRALECPFGQGYHLARPGPPEAIVALL